jgi:hypothetical protein
VRPLCHENSISRQHLHLQSSVLFLVFSSVKSAILSSSGAFTIPWFRVRRNRATIVLLGPPTIALYRQQADSFLQAGRVTSISFFSNYALGFLLVFSKPFVESRHPVFNLFRSIRQSTTSVSSFSLASILFFLVSTHSQSDRQLFSPSLLNQISKSNLSQSNLMGRGGYN